MYGEVVAKACTPSPSGKYKSKDHCLNSGCEERSNPAAGDVPDEYSKTECEKRWCTGDLKGKRWKICYHKNALKYHPDKGGGPEAEIKFKELGKCQGYSDQWK